MKITVTDLRRNPDYAIYYNNWTRLVVLGIIPFAMLVYFNYKVCSLTYYLWSIGMFPFISFTHVFYVPKHISYNWYLCTLLPIGTRDVPIHIFTCLPVGTPTHLIHAYLWELSIHIFSHLRPLGLCPTLIGPCVLTNNYSISLHRYPSLFYLLSIIPKCV